MADWPAAGVKVNGWLWLLGPPAMLTLPFGVPACGRKSRREMAPWPAWTVTASVPVLLGTTLTVTRGRGWQTGPVGVAVGVSVAVGVAVAPGTDVAVGVAVA